MEEREATLGLTDKCIALLGLLQTSTSEWLAQKKETQIWRLDIQNYVCAGLS